MQPPPPRLARFKLWQAARKHIAVLLERQDHKCFWCQRELYIRSTIPVGWVIIPKKSKSENTFHIRNEEGIIKHVLRATVDHINPIGKTDPAIVNELNNLVASCQSCNNRRTNSLKKQNKVCKKCKTNYVATIGLCIACRKEQQVYWELMKVTRT